MDKEPATAPSKGGLKALSLSFNFFLIIVAYYLIKPASRTIFMEALGSDKLPYVWIGSALALGILMPFYNRAVKYFKRQVIVITSLSVFAILLLLFSQLLQEVTVVNAVSFYIIADIFSVVLVEQFWSLANCSYRTGEGKKWYGFIGSGGLLGGIAGGALATYLLKKMDFKTLDLLLVSVGFLALLIALTYAFVRAGLYRELKPVESGARVDFQTSWSAFVKSRYLILITATLILAQLAEPIVEFQFMGAVEEAYSEREARAAFLSTFLSMLGMAALAVNIILTPVIHRKFGVIFGLTAQPGLLLFGVLIYFFSPALWSGGLLKISDRGLSYSINRASKELLYVPLDPKLIYQSKAWIDMFGYRFFKVLGSIIILSLTEWFSFGFSGHDLSYATFIIVCGWLWAIKLLKIEYDKLTKA